MKILSFVFVLLFVRVQASFFDDFRGAISNINSGFGKLFGDVISDVKDTVYCTISAVEQVLVQNGLLDKRTLYNQKCKGVETPQQQSVDFQNGSTNSKTVSKIRKHSVIHHKHSSRRVSHKTGHSVKSVNTTTNVLGNTDLNNASADQLAEISKILRQESENISRSFKNELKQLQTANSQTTVKSILEEIKYLNNLRRNSKNETEVNEISRIFDKLSSQMNSTINFDRILDTNEEKLNITRDTQGNKSVPQNGNLNTTINFKDVAVKTSNNTNEESKKTGTETQIKDIPAANEYKQKPVESKEKTDKSIFSLGLDTLKSFFKSISASPEDIHKAQDIVAHSQHSDKVLNALFKG